LNAAPINLLSVSHKIINAAPRDFRHRVDATALSDFLDVSSPRSSASMYMLATIPRTQSTPDGKLGKPVRREKYEHEKRSERSI